MNQTTSHPDRSLGRALWSRIRDRWYLPTILVIVASAFAFAWSTTKPNQYEGTASLLFRDPQFDVKLFGTSFSSVALDPQAESATNTVLTELPNVARETALVLAEPTTQPAIASIQSAVRVAQAGQANLVNVTATAPTPERARRLANAYAASFVRLRRRTDIATIARAQGEVGRQLTALPTATRNGSVGRQLQARIEQLSVLRSLQTGRVELTQLAEQPSGPVSPRPARAALAAGFVAFVLSLIGIGIWARLDRKLRDASSVTRLLGKPVLAEVPQAAALLRTVNVVDVSNTQVLDSFRSLRANLKYFGADSDGAQAIVVTSTAPGEGKTTVASCLAAAGVQAGTRTILIEADLRRPALSRMFTVPTRATGGLASYLAGLSDRESLVTNVQLSTADLGESPSPTTAQLDVIFAGALPPNPAELLEGERFRELLQALRQEYDFIVIDSPPLGLLPDATPIVGQTDGVLLVVRIGRTLTDALAALRDQLEHLNARCLGAVVNGARQTTGSYYESAYYNTSSSDQS